MTDLNKTFHDKLEERTITTNKKLDELNERITNLDLYFEQQKKDILKYIDDRGEELTKLLNKFKVFLYYAFNSINNNNGNDNDNYDINIILYVIIFTKK